MVRNPLRPTNWTDRLRSSRPSGHYTTSFTRVWARVTAAQPPCAPRKRCWHGWTLVPTAHATAVPVVARDTGYARLAAHKTQPRSLPFHPKDRTLLVHCEKFNLTQKPSGLRVCASWSLPCWPGLRPPACAVRAGRCTDLRLQYRGAPRAPNIFLPYRLCGNLV